MTVRRIMGLETEFGVSQPGRPEANPMRDSARVIDAYAAQLGLRSAQSFWDFTTESPLADARGFLMSLGEADISQLTHRPDLQPEAEYLANVVLHNGARYYVDHAHPEYSSPEVTTPRDAVVFDRAGDLAALHSVRALGETAEPVNLYKNNTDGKGSSYGTHENYLVPRSVEFEDIAAGLIPFFVTRQIITGAGRVGIGQKSETAGFQLSSRADFFEAEVGLETTIRRPIINTRDEPHATHDKYRRLHVIIGDANLAEVASLLKTGMTSLVLALIEHGMAPQLRLADPLAAIRAVSQDPSLQVRIGLADGRSLTAVEIQREYLAAARVLEGDDADADTAEILQLWDEVLTDLTIDPMRCADRLDWVAKLALLEGYRRRESLGWDSPKLRMIDVQYADVRPEKGLFHKLEAAGRIRRLTTDEQVRAALVEPPVDTRAWLRGKAVAKFGREVAGANWDALVFERRGPDGRELVRLPMPEPEADTRDLAGPALDNAANAAELLAGLQRNYT